jgi:hypothetical protein
MVLLYFVASRKIPLLAVYNSIGIQHSASAVRPGVAIGGKPSGPRFFCEPTGSPEVEKVVSITKTDAAERST